MVAAARGGDTWAGRAVEGARRRTDGPVAPCPGGRPWTVAECSAWLQWLDWRREARSRTAGTQGRVLSPACLSGGNPVWLRGSAPIGLPLLRAPYTSAEHVRRYEAGLCRRRSRAIVS